MALVVYSSGALEPFLGVADKYDGVDGTEVYVWGVKRGGEFSSYVCCVASSPDICASVDGTLSECNVLSTAFCLEDVSRSECVFPRGVPMAVVENRIREHRDNMLESALRRPKATTKSVDDLLRERAVREFRARG